MAALALINPRKRRKAKAAKRRKTKTTAKVVRTRKSRKSHSATVRVRMANPKRRRSAARRRRNPSGLSGKALQAKLMPALAGAAGALLIDKVFDLAADKLPDTLREGWGRYAALVGIALVAGYGLEKAKVLSPSTRNNLIMGSLTVTAFKAASTEIMPMISANVPMLAPAPTTSVKGFQAAQLQGFQPAQLMAMPNSGMTSGNFATRRPRSV